MSLASSAGGRGSIVTGVCVAGSVEYSGTANAKMELALGMTVVRVRNCNG